MVIETGTAITYPSAPPEHVADLHPVHGFWVIGCLPDRHLTPSQAYAAVSIADALATNVPWLRAFIPKWAGQLDMTIHHAHTVFGAGTPVARRWATAMQALA